MATLICRTDERNDIGIHGVSSKDFDRLAEALNLKIHEAANHRFMELEIGKVKLSFFSKENK